MRRTLPSQLFRPEQYWGFLGRSTGTHQDGVAAELFRVLTSVPGCLEEFWSTIEPAFRAGLIQTAARKVFTTASLVVRDTACLPDHLKWLDESGVSREYNRQIRYVIETYYHIEPCQAVLAAVAHRWILGLSSSSLAARVMSADDYTEPCFTGAVEVIGKNETPSCLKPIADKYGRPVHSFFRALAVWPDYLQKAWEDLGPFQRGVVYPAVMADLQNAVDDASRRIPICRDVPAFGLGPYDIAGSIQQCIDHSCEVILCAAALRRMFIRAETLARNKRIRESLQDMNQ